MDGGVDTTIFAAFGVGMLSFFSPCVLPLVPGYLSAISGVAGDGDGGGRRMLGPALLFVLAFTTIFVALGLGATGLGQTLTDNLSTLRKISGAAIVLLGVFMAATLVLPRLNREWRPEQLAHKAGSGGPLVAGAAFAIAWTPCTGPFLGQVLSLAVPTQSPKTGASLLFTYALGLGIPFLLAGLFLTQTMSISRKVRDHWRIINLVAGAITIGLGILVATGRFTVITQKVSDLGIGL